MLFYLTVLDIYDTIFIWKRERDVLKALVLAGGFPQIALIKELKERGYTVVLADYNENPVARKYADIYYMESTLDVPAIENIARKEKVDFLITACTDQALLTVAKVSETLGLPCYIDYETALNVTNKAYMKKVFAENGVSTSKYVVMEELDLNKIADMRYPLIVKPVDCNSSKGVKKVTNEEELKLAFADAVRFSRTDNAIVEEFVTGIELSVDVYVEDGVAHVLSVSKLDKIKDADKFVIFRGWYPALEAEKVMGHIKETAQGIADAFGLKNTPMLIQMMSDGERVYVLEFSARTGGGVKYILINKATGFDVIKAVVEKAKGEFKYMVNSFIYCKKGVFDHLEGFEEMKNSGAMLDYYLFKLKGAEFDTVENSGDRIAGFTIAGNTMEELCDKHDIIAENIKVIAENGEDIMRHDLLESLR